LGKEIAEKSKIGAVMINLPIIGSDVPQDISNAVRQTDEVISELDDQTFQDGAVLRWFQGGVGFEQARLKSRDGLIGSVHA
jgi:hypothetical protein